MEKQTGVYCVEMIYHLDPSTDHRTCICASLACLHFLRPSLCQRGGVEEYLGSLIRE